MKVQGAKADGPSQTGEVIALHAEGVSLSEIARRLEIGRGSVHRILAAGLTRTDATVRVAVAGRAGTPSI
jgi:DNA-binding NarL/FixJ family response regulator